MKIELRTIDHTNMDDVISLEVFDHQKAFIASNLRSIETAQEEEHRNIARPFAIYAEDNLVGFCMFAFEPEAEDEEDRYWLWRFMIDRKEQGKGYGQAALDEIISYFRDHGANQIFLSTEPENECGLHVYHKAGFQETGEFNDDEAVLKLILS